MDEGGTIRLRLFSYCSLQQLFILLVYEARDYQGPWSGEIKYAQKD